MNSSIFYACDNFNWIVSVIFKFEKGGGIFPRKTKRNETVSPMGCRADSVSVSADRNKGAVCTVICVDPLCMVGYAIHEGKSARE